MAYKVIILYRLYMPPYFLGTFTEYPCIKQWRLHYIHFYSGSRHCFMLTVVSAVLISALPVTFCLHTFAAL